MNMLATIWPAESALARCSSCGTQRQFHRGGRGCDAFNAETAADIEPADLRNLDLLRECARLDGEAAAASDEAYDAVTDRLSACRAELDARIKATFGGDFDDLRGAMGW